MGRNPSPFLLRVGKHPSKSCCFPAAMQLRALIAAAFIARLLFRAWWRRSFIKVCLFPLSGQDALQGWLILQAALLEGRWQAAQ